MELDAFAEMERPALVIGRRLPARREPRILRQLAVGCHADQVVEHERHVVLHHVTAQDGVEHLRREAGERDGEIRLALRGDRRREDGDRQKRRQESDREPHAELLFLSSDIGT